MASEARRRILRSERLFLRPIERVDVEPFTKWINEADFADPLAARGPVSVAAQERWVERMQAEQGQTRWRFAVCRRDDEQPVGYVSLDSIDPLNGCAELNIGIGEASSRDRGLGTEAMDIIVDFGFAELGLHRVFLHVFAANARAVHVYLRIGFRHEATLRDSQFQHDRYHDVYVMGLLRDEWEAQDRPRTPEHAQA